MNELLLTGRVSQPSWWGKTINAKAVRKWLNEAEGDITIKIDSFGGDVYEGINIYNLIRGYAKTKGKVTTIAMSKVMSIATLFLLAGDERKAHKNSTIMNHKAWSGGYGNSDEMEKKRKILDGIDDILANEYHQVMPDMTIEAIKIEMGKEMWFVGAKQLLESGMVSEIVENETLDPVEDPHGSYDSFFAEFQAKALEMGFKPDYDNAEQTIEACYGECDLNNETKVVENPTVNGKQVTNDSKGDISMDYEKKYNELTASSKATIEALNATVGEKEAENKELQEQVTALKEEEKGLDRNLAKEFVAIGLNNNLNMADTLALFDNESMADAMVMAKEKAKPLASGSVGAGSDSTPNNNSNDGDEPKATITDDEVQEVLDGK